jgi:hypothetical protein
VSYADRELLIASPDFPKSITVQKVCRFVYVLLLYAIRGHTTDCSTALVFQVARLLSPARARVAHSRPPSPKNVQKPRTLCDFDRYGLHFDYNDFNNVNHLGI